MLPMTPAEFRMLRTLDLCLFEDAEEGGDGWLSTQEFARLTGYSDGWVRERLNVLVRRGLVEKRHRELNLTDWVWSTTEKGAELLSEKETA